MGTIKINWKNKKRYSSSTKAICNKLIVYIRKYPLSTGRELSYILKVEPATIRQLIKTIRENNDKFLNKKEFLVARTTGYLITKNKKEIAAFVKKTHLMGQSKMIQVEQGFKALGKKGW